MTADDARKCVTTVRGLLREVMRTLSRPRPDWGHAAVMLDWAATLCMELARDCRREAEDERRDWTEDGYR
ncbi:hypothetical protein [Thermophilibacter provencensis]|uniref:hypothetical protein n=1 Tax=Thermophilibacter provencensis TaxID=1852386 RepID=UPI00294297B1|nr:hypothetical protein [Thermophilibacter provencensis]